MAERQSSRSQVKWLVLAVAVVLALILILQNTQSVPVHLLFWTWDASLLLLTVIIAALGFVAGWLIGRR